MSLSGYFITGSDTGVGKTWIGCQMVQQLRQKHRAVKVRKPVESGCIWDPELGYLPADGSALFNANNANESLDIVTPFRYAAALATDRAARLEGDSLTLVQLTTACTNQVGPQDTLLVEGAGGFYSPICDDGLNSDLARSLGLDVIIVCDDRLGAINQALLTISAVKQEGLGVQAVVLNQTRQLQDSDGLNNLEDLRQRTAIPIHGCNYGGVLKTTVV
jgi:dethiobiotin synthetase